MNAKSVMGYSGGRPVQGAPDSLVGFLCDDLKLCSNKPSVFCAKRLCDNQLWPSHMHFFEWRVDLSCLDKRIHVVTHAHAND